MRPADLPATESFAHGTRARYVSGCRCDECREANRAYARMRGKLQRMGRGNPLVDAAAARLHIFSLSKQQVGRRAIHAASGVSLSVIMEIKNRTKTQIRKDTESKILAVKSSARLPNALVPATKTQAKIKTLLQDEGFTKAEIARRLGFQRTLQIGKRKVTQRTAARISDFYEWGIA